LRLLLVGLAASLVLAAGPFDIKLFPGTSDPDASGHARLVYAQSPYGIAVDADGRARYDVQVTATGLPAPSAIGAGYHAYVAWSASPDLTKWSRLGTITNGTTTVGSVDLNKFLFVVTAESSATATTHSGPTVLHGSSPSAWLQNFLSHPLFRGNPQ
jgi:hypothetical protein